MLTNIDEDLRSICALQLRYENRIWYEIHGDIDLNTRTYAISRWRSSAFILPTSKSSGMLTRLPDTEGPDKVARTVSSLVTAGDTYTGSYKLEANEESHRRRKC